MYNTAIEDSALAKLPSMKRTDVARKAGELWQRLTTGEPVLIKHYRKACAVVLTPEEYLRLKARAEPDLEAMTERFDALYERMQAPDDFDAAMAALDVSEDELGRAAVAGARKPARG